MFRFLVLALAIARVNANTCACDLCSDSWQYSSHGLFCPCGGNTCDCRTCPDCLTDCVPCSRRKLLFGHLPDDTETDEDDTACCYYSDEDSTCPLMNVPVDTSTLDCDCSCYNNAWPAYAWMAADDGSQSIQCWTLLSAGGTCSDEDMGICDPAADWQSHLGDCC